jgi:uncharacterized Zn ribbon protein
VEDENKIIHRDSNCYFRAWGLSCTHKKLESKGCMVAKQGTAVRNIGLDHAEYIEGKVDGQNCDYYAIREET